MLQIAMPPLAAWLESWSGQCGIGMLAAREPWPAAVAPTMPNGISNTAISTINLTRARRTRNPLGLRHRPRKSMMHLSFRHHQVMRLMMAAHGWDSEKAEPAVTV